MNDEIMNESVETQEVAEPETEELESEEMQEVAEPAESDNSEEDAAENSANESKKTDSDAAFAEMRRNNQAMEKSLNKMREALSRYFDGETDEDLIINALAFADERDPDEYRQEYQQNEELEALKSEKETLEDQLLDLQIEKILRESLTEVQAIDPSVKSTEELGESFVKFLANGMTSAEAYYAVKAMELKEKVLAPDPIGRIADTRTERDYYTAEELDNMDIDEIQANWDKVMLSMQKLGK